MSVYGKWRIGFIVEHMRNPTPEEVWNAAIASVTPVEKASVVSTVAKRISSLFKGKPA